MLHSLNGFDEYLVTRLPAADTRWFRLVNIWALAGIMCCGASAALLAFFCGTGLLWALVAGLMVTSIMCGLQMYGNRTVNLSPIREVQGRWALHGPARAILAGVLTLICLIFTQPFLLPWAVASARGTLPTEADIRKGVEAAAQQRQVDRIQQDIALIQAQADRLGVSSAPPVAIDSLEPAERAALQLPLAKRKALVIGNNAYDRLQPLEGAVNDASGMKEMLTQLGFEVTLLTNVNRVAMEAGIEAYARSLKPGDVSLFHFSGHGFQARGSNYLAPTDYQGDPDAVRPSAPAVNLIIETIDRRRPLASILILDACRENLVGAAKQGLAALEAGVNTYIAFAAGPGQLAREVRSDSGQSYGLFSAAIVRNLAKGGELDQVFRAVRSDVAAASRRINPIEPPQETWTQHNLTAPLELRATSTVGLRNASGRANTAGGETTVGSDTSSRYAPLTLSSGSKVCEVATSSGNRTSEDLTFDYRKCLAGHLLRLREALHDAQQEVATGQDLANPAVRSSTSQSSRRAMAAFRQLWSDPLIPALVSMALLFLMAGGMVWRSRLDVLNDAYSRELHLENRDVVEEEAHRLLNFARNYPALLNRQYLKIDDEHLKRRFLDRLGTEQSTEPAASSQDALMEFLGVGVPVSQAQTTV